MANLINGLGGDYGFGETSVYRNDDGYSSVIDVTSVFENGINFFGEQWDDIYVNTNGNITFQSGLSTFTPDSIGQDFTSPIIAPFWADVDTRTGVSSITPGGTSQGSNLVWIDLDPSSNIVTITWDDVGYYNRKDDLLNSFQLRLIQTDTNGDFIMEFRYENIDWLTGSASGGVNGLGGSMARAGFSSGAGNVYHEFYQSGTESMLNLENTFIGDANEAGVWRYYVAGGDVGGIGFEDSDDNLEGSSSSDIMDGGSGDDSLNGYDGDDLLSGGFGNDQINGGNGDDMLVGGPGSDTLDGGEGIDTAAYNDYLENLIIEYLNNFRYEITDSAGETDTLSNVEFLDTFDGQYALESDQSGYSANDDLFIVQHDGIISRGIGNDTYVFAPAAVASNADISISDTQGDNTLQFTAGFSVSSSMIATDGLLLNMTNGTTITILSASNFEFELGGNPLSGVAGETYSFSEFVETVIGSTVPTSGATSANGFTIANDTSGNSSTDTIEIIVGESTSYSGTEAQDIFTLDVITASQSTADTQVALDSFDTAEDRLQLSIEGIVSGEYTLQDLAGTTSITAQQNPFDNSILVNLGADADGDAIAITLNGMSDTDSVYVDII